MINWRYITQPLKVLSLALLTSIVLYITWILIAYRDIPVEQLAQKYGGDNLQTLNIDGVNLRYKIEGNGPAIVLIHSHFYTMRQWQTWVDILKNDFTIIRYDLTSHGLTGPDPSNDYSRKRASSLLNSLLIHTGIETASIVGSSTGGGIAYDFAARFPEKVENLVLINAAGMPKVTNKYMKYKLPSWGGYLLYLLPESLFKTFLQAPIIDKSLITKQQVTEFHEMYRRTGNRMAEFERILAWEKADVSPILAKITAPTLILWGEKNPQLPVEHVQQFTEKLTSSKFVQQIVYPNIGHVIPIENPQQSANDVANFITNSFKQKLADQNLTDIEQQ